MESKLDIFVSPIIIKCKASFLFVKRGGYFEESVGRNPQAKRIDTRGTGCGIGGIRQTIGSLENGRYNPSIMLAFKIARFFGMTIEEIFIYEEESK